MDDQSLSGLRVCLHVLLRALYPRIYGARRRGIRKENFREKRRRGAAGSGPAQVFVCVEKLGRSVPGAHCDWHSDGSVPAGGAGVWRDACMPRGARKARRAERFVDYKIEPDCAGHRSVQEDRGALGTVAEHHDHHAAAATGALARAASATSRLAAGGRAAIARGRAGDRGVSLPLDSGNDRSRGRTGGRCGGGEEGGGDVVLLKRVVPDALFSETVFAVCAREISEVGEAIRALVREKRICAVRVPQANVAAGG